MKKIPALILVLFFGINGYSQNSFMKGYYIDNSNHKIDCFIENIDWLNNPTEFTCKITESSNQKTLSIHNVKEFGILNTSKYVRHNVDIDRSSSRIDELDYNNNPVLNNEVLFLKVLIEGKANLFFYEDHGLFRYFFNINQDDVKQLVYKEYLNDEDQISKNNAFRGQLWNTLKLQTLNCESISMDDVAELIHRESELIKFFIKYNDCVKSEYVNYKKKKDKKGLFNLTLRPGIRTSSLIVDGPVREQFNFDKGLTTYRLGLESEFILGFNNNKWAIILEPTYQEFESETMIVSNKTTDEKLVANVDYKSLETQFGLRYYMFINKNLRLFTNALATYDYRFNSSVKVTRESNGNNFFSAKMQSGMSVALGVGGKFKDRYSFELRYLPNRNILNSQGNWITKYKSLSFVLGYSMF